jgi:hypothetical protein
LHLAIGALIGGVMNLIMNADEIDNFWEGLGYFGIGAAAGALGAGVGAGVNVAIAGGSFAAGFIGTSTIVSTGFCAGFVSGAAGGFSGGFASGFGNTSMEPGNNLGDMFKSGFDYGWKGAVIGGVAGGVIGGIDAVNQNRNFWTGAPKQKVVFSIDLNGNVRLIDALDYDRGSTVLLHDYSTDVSDYNIIDSEGFYHVKVQIPDEIYGAFPVLRANETAGITDYIINKNYVEMISLNPIKRASFYGWKYYSRPINSINDLFHFRNFIWPW